jgi:hypothetical protein
MTVWAYRETPAVRRYSKPFSQANIANFRATLPLVVDRHVSPEETSR